MSSRRASGIENQPIYKALVRLSAFGRTLRPDALTRNRYAALFDVPAVNQFVGPFASDEQRAQRLSEAIKDAVAAIDNDRDKLVGEALLCTRDDFAGETVGDRKYFLAISSQRITHDMYRESRLRVLAHVYRELATARRHRGISGAPLLISVSRAGIALHYASIAEVFRLVVLPLNSLIHASSTLPV